CHQPGDHGKGPLIGVVKEHAVTVTVNHSVRDVCEQVAPTADRNGHFDAFIGGGDPRGGGASAADPGDSDPIRVHIRTAGEIIDAANAVPAFHPGWSVATRKPPPTPFTIRAMMRAGQFPHLDGIYGQANVTVTRKPDAVRLVSSFVSIPSAGRVTADVEYGGEANTGFGFCRPIEVARDIQAWTTLEMDHVDHVIGRCPAGNSLTRS